MAETEKFYEKFMKRKSEKNVKKDFQNTQKTDFKSSKNKSCKKQKNEESGKKTFKTFHNDFKNLHKTENYRDSNQKNCIYTLENTLFSTKNLTKETFAILENFDQIVQSVRPLNSRQIQQLPDNIRNLSHQLTDQRSERRLGYLNDTIQLSSYVRYYTWWNLVRLTRLFSNLPEESFPQNDGICLDLGTGPLTVVTALWLARPQLRKYKLTWYCLDVSPNSMIFGEDIYFSIAAKTPENEPWKIIRIKGAFGTQIKQKAEFITCANMFNELDQGADMPPEFQSKKYFQQLLAYGTKNSKFLLIEPGVPKASRTLSLLRSRFLCDRKKVVAPCPHHLECPMNGFKAYTGSSHKWCNFAFSTEDAPAKLQKLSERAKLPKERATLSFISISTPENSSSPNSEQKNPSKTQTNTQKQTQTELLCRIASDSFRVGNKTGFYACSELGLTLLRLNSEFTNIIPQKNDRKIEKNNNKGEKNTVIHTDKTAQQKENFVCGALLKVKIKSPDSLPKDEKSGALIVDL